MADHYCKKCKAKLEDQFMFDPQAETYVCTKCSTELYKKGDNYQILVRCPQCDAVVNSQFFFDPEKDVCRCSRCKTDLVREKGKYVIHYRCPACHAGLNEQFDKGPVDYWVCRSCHQKLKMDFYKYVKIRDDYFPPEFEEPIIEEPEPEETNLEEAVLEELSMEESGFEEPNMEEPEFGETGHERSELQNPQIPATFAVEGLDSDYAASDSGKKKWIDFASKKEDPVDALADAEDPDDSDLDDLDPDEDEYDDSDLGEDESDDSDLEADPAAKNPIERIRKKFRRLRERERYSREVARGVASRLYGQILLSLKILLVLLVVGAIGLGIFEVSKLIPVGYRSANLLGCKVESVVTKMEEAGFTRIVTEEIEDLDSAHSFQEDLVSSIKIGWATSFEKDSKYPSNFKVTITYHSMMPIPIPFSSKDAKLMDYEAAINELEKAGFTNIKTEKVTNLISGLLKKDGQVTEILVNGKSFYQADTKYKPDVEIIVRYKSKE